MPQKRIQTAFRPSWMNRASEWHKRFKEGRESVRNDERCVRSKEVNRPELIGQRVRVRVYYVDVLREFRKRFLGKRPALFKSGQWHFHQDNTPVHNSILDQDGHQDRSSSPYCPDLAPCDFWLFPKLRDCRYQTIEEIKEAVTIVIDIPTQEDFHGAFQKLL